MALRVEEIDGIAYWRAYYAATDTMDGAIFLACIAMSAIVNNRARKEAFMTMIRDVIADILEERAGVRPTWRRPHKAPEGER